VGAPVESKVRAGRWESRVVAIAALTALAACGNTARNPDPAPVAPQAPEPSRPVAVTVLYTSDEHGWLLPHPDKHGRVRGGAANVLGHWIAHEGHCPGPLPPEAAAEPAAAGCADPPTLALSGGDNYTGPAISSFFGGEPMAHAFSRMGYAASAFGNHEFDFGRDQFLKNRQRSRMVYLGANVRVKDAGTNPVALPKFAIFERRGVKVGVIGLATESTLTTAMASRFEGMDFLAMEPAMDEAVREAWAQGSDAVVAIAHECPDKLVPLLERHPEWKLSFFGGGHCHRAIDLEAHGVRVMSPGWRFDGYIKLALEVDRNKPARERVIRAEPSLVHMARDPGAEGPSDEPLAAMARAWNDRLDRTLGEEIGYAAQGLAKDSPQLAEWVAGTWREELKVDVAIINMGAIRQALPKGVITKATIYSVLPFDNKLVVCRLSGSDLIVDLLTEEAVAAGVTRRGRGFFLSDGKPIVADRMYTVATIDFLYFGGSNFAFQRQDPAARDTGIDWREPVIDWTRRLKTTASAPLERRLGGAGPKRP
jgi:5'-nucleotidase / UDP-sugar diphosphatase